MKLKRELGEFAISVGTSVAIEEGLMTAERKPEQIWVNIRTLFRNIHSSLENKTGIRPKDLALDLVEEMHLLETAISSVTDDHTETVYYYPTYQSLEKLFPKALHKRPKTVRQLEYAQAEKSVFQEVFKHPIADLHIVKGDTAVKGNDKDSFMITHYPVDLLSKRYFSRLALLETHTGKIKRENAWSTKLTGGNHLIAMPFNALTLQVFGDSATQFNSMPHVYKKSLTELSTARRWNSLTTKDKINSDVRTLDNPETTALFRSLLACTVK